MSTIEARDRVCDRGQLARQEISTSIFLLLTSIQEFARLVVDVLSRVLLNGQEKRTEDGHSDR
jgi:hypothetical protein